MFAPWRSHNPLLKRDVSDYWKIIHLSDENFQQLWIKVQVRHCKSIFICTVYGPPGTTLAFSDSLSRSLLDMLLHGNDIIILGDLNCNILDDTVDSPNFIELCASFNLRQLVKEPTRITETKRSLIDVIMTTDPTLAEQGSFLHEHARPLT